MEKKLDKYRNPEAPLGYIKPSQYETKEPEEDVGVVIDGVFCRYIGITLNSNMYDLPDITDLEKFVILSSDEEDDAEYIPDVFIKQEVIDEDYDDMPGPSRKNDQLEDDSLSVLCKKTIKKEVEDECSKKVKTKIKREHRNYSDESDHSTSHTKHKSKKGSRRHHSRSESPHKNELDDTADHSSSHVKHKSKKKTRKERSHSRSPEYQVDSNSDEGDAEFSSKKEYIKRTPSPEYYERVVKIKEEPKEPLVSQAVTTQHLFGSYHCEVCNITMNSLQTYNMHVNGKRHLKELKKKGEKDVKLNILPPPESTSNATDVIRAVARSVSAVSLDEICRYPKPPSGVQRRKLRERAYIQDRIDVDLIEPCPGLEEVIEIQGISAVQYYCGLCNIVCSGDSIISHLKGQKHRLYCLKHFKPELHEELKSRMERSKHDRYHADKTILSALKHVEDRRGRGNVSVERDSLTCPPRNLFYSSGNNDNRSILSSREMPSTSGYHPPDYYQSTTLPDQSKSDYYCPTCDSHMNSYGMWQSHVNGKRHLTNIKKVPGTHPSKTKSIPINLEPVLLQRLRDEDVREPIVGLNQVQETHIPETGSESYHCFLCGSYVNSFDIIDHLVSFKHRTKYLDHIDFPGKEVIAGMGERSAEPIVEEMCAQAEDRYGMGRPTVHMSKSAIQP